ncbi:hypothetical protein [Methylobacterium sp. ARG-1]|nr:hypothetical protein [Methylobacterium sp. ARG-1]
MTFIKPTLPAAFDEKPPEERCAFDVTKKAAAPDRDKRGKPG